VVERLERRWLRGRDVVHAVGDAVGGLQRLPLSGGGDRHMRERDVERRDADGERRTDRRLGRGQPEPGVRGRDAEPDGERDGCDVVELGGPERIYVDVADADADGDDDGSCRRVHGDGVEHVREREREHPLGDGEHGAGGVVAAGQPDNVRGQRDDVHGGRERRGPELAVAGEHERGEHVVERRQWRLLQWRDDLHTDGDSLVGAQRLPVSSGGDRHMRGRDVERRDADGQWPTDRSDGVREPEPDLRGLDAEPDGERDGSDVVELDGPERIYVDVADADADRGHVEPWRFVHGHGFERLRGWGAVHDVGDGECVRRRSVWFRAGGEHAVGPDDGLVRRGYAFVGDRERSVFVDL
jgi:hypothetical protein